MIPLIKTMSMLVEPEAPQTEEEPAESMTFHAENDVPSVAKFHEGRPTRVRLTNVTDRLVSRPTHLAIATWVPVGSLPKQVGYVRLDSKKRRDRGDDSSSEHVVAEFELEDYAKELAFLPDLTEPAESKLDYSPKNVQNPELSTEQQVRLDAVLNNHDKIIISSGNALPPRAYGVGVPDSHCTKEE
ncbi:unnamed protein product [Phytophthora fragariaefolia]|uniref:Unnamed protein product n=1 Tax=Phytophthora fragariaefolia TaxID=1490495 RepID=A0A9W6WX85_9STRA|nr:unnamed protein product [Phytophthora fragariaefolia]